MSALPKKIFGQNGFTLIEVLVAVTIVAMIFTLVFGTFFYMVDNAEEQEERAALYHRAAYILNDISRTVSSACLPFGGIYTDKNLKESVFLGKVEQTDDYEAASLSTYTTNPFYGTQGEIQDTLHVSYQVVHSRDMNSINWIGDENNPLVLMCYVESLFSDSDDDDPKQPAWMLNIRSLNIEYSDDGSSWIADWDYEELGALPEAIRIELELGDSRGATYTFSTMAVIHVNTELEEAS